MKIKKLPADIVITFSPKDYFLLKCKDNTLGDYVLHYRIDRSYKGKDDDIGMEKMYLDKTEARNFIEAGFQEII